MENKAIFLEKLQAIDAALTVACELTDTVLSATAKAVMLDDLMAYDTQAVLTALNRCRRELSGRLTLAAIIERIPSGALSADEAFGLMLRAWQDEGETVVVPKAALLAAGNGAAALFHAGDKVGARMAFREAYNRADDAAKQDWAVSLGYDPYRREQAIEAAIAAKRLPEAYQKMLPPPEPKAMTEEQRANRQLVLAQIKAVFEQAKMV